MGNYATWSPCGNGSPTERRAERNGARGEWRYLLVIQDDSQDGETKPEGRRSRRKAAHDDRYELLTPIGAGGMATVWAARQRGPEGFGRIVAIKTMLPDLAHE